VFSYIGFYSGFEFNIEVRCMVEDRQEIVFRLSEIESRALLSFLWDATIHNKEKGFKYTEKEVLDLIRKVKIAIDDQVEKIGVTRKAAVIK